MRDPDERPDPVDRLRRRDEILQVLFWLEGEGFLTDMTEEGVARFLPWPARRIRAGLEDLVDTGFAAADDDAGDRRAYRLTEVGRREGGRRFVEEFAPMLSRNTHAGGECHDPDCACHEDPLGAAACTGADGEGRAPRV